MTTLPRRLLLGPGPSNVHPDVLAAMAQPIVGHLDPAFLDLADSVQAALRRLFGTTNPRTLPLSATGSGGMQACFANLVEPGDAVLIGVAGLFGERMCEVATRLGAQVHRVDAAWGRVLDAEAMRDAIARVRPSLVAFVHAETSTGACQPVEAIACAAREHEALVMLDCVTSLSGIPVTLDAWSIDAAYSGTQKCLACPPGLSPASFSSRALERVAKRRTPVSSWYFDLDLLGGYFGERRAYHHTAPITAVVGLAAALERVEAEGMAAREVRHRAASAYLLERLAPLGFEPLVAAQHRLPMLNSLLLPERVTREGEAVVRRRLLDRHGIEVGGGLGQLAGKIWRVGLMGENATSDAVDRLVAALEAELG